MLQGRNGSLLTAVAAAGFFATAVIHSTGYDSVTALAEQGPGDLAPLIPALWLVFSFDLAVIGLIMIVIACRPAGPAWLIAGIAALCPLGAAALQLHFIGFIFPTAILLSLATLTIIAAINIRRKAIRNGKSAA